MGRNMIEAIHSLRDWDLWRWTLIQRAWLCLGSACSAQLYLLERRLYYDITQLYCIALKAALLREMYARGVL